MKPSIRVARQGPELDLVLEYVVQHVPKAPSRQMMNFFFEPKLESGFPDVVIAYWKLDVLESWPLERRYLTLADIRLIHHLSTNGPGSSADLRVLFTVNVDRAVERLADAALIHKTKGLWAANPLSKIFALRRLIAIEAKIGSWRRGLSQAINNRWFASESYLLLPNLPQNSDLSEHASKFGIGILTRNVPIGRAVVAARPESIPRSYASWLFNEWLLSDTMFQQPA